MPFPRCARGPSDSPSGRSRRWPDSTVDRAPVWAPVDLRDGNQAPAAPKDARRKKRMFDLLVATGCKDIEIGFPAAGALDFDFVRELVVKREIPDGVTVSVFTPARPELIERTMARFAGRNAPRCICATRRRASGARSSTPHRAGHSYSMGRGRPHAPGLGPAATAADAAHGSACSALRRARQEKDGALPSAQALNQE
ncbi:hypothetical protein [Streptomyces agglomeratus]|uniref:hypothetical protein n=1 Tax=Streptomyces agglomeratus TaxID=285458 RepID=UPI00099F3F86